MRSTETYQKMISGFGYRDTEAARVKGPRSQGKVYIIDKHEKTLKDRENKISQLSILGPKDRHGNEFPGFFLPHISKIMY